MLQSRNCTCPPDCSTQCLCDTCQLTLHVRFMAKYGVLGAEAVLHVPEEERSAVWSEYKVNEAFDCFVDKDQVLSVYCEALILTLH